MQTPASSGPGPDGPAGVEAPINVAVDRVSDGVVVLGVTGEVDLLTASVLGERLREQLDSASRVLVLDLSSVSFLGSAGLAEIVSASQAGTDRGARVLLVATGRAVLRPLEVTGLLSLFTVYDTVESALASVER
ncbi:MAG: STAS domain-containing protein [Labedaea sp.]